MKSCRAPSYKAIALAVLRNDHNLHSLGFTERSSATVDILIALKRPEKPLINYEMFAA